MREFKVGDRVVWKREGYRKKQGIIKEITENPEDMYPIEVKHLATGLSEWFTIDGRYFLSEELCLQHIEETFEIGDKVYHPDFGEGIITRMSVNFLNPDETMLEVSFAKERKILGFFPDGRFCKNGEITLRKLEKEDE